MSIAIPPRQTFETSRGYDYSYIHIPSTASKPTLFFIHGFPSHIPDWTHQISFFGAKGLGILACDLLGFGRSSKPTDPSAYRLQILSEDLADLLRALKLDKVIGVGHDIGATLLSRFAVYHPDKVSALVLLAVGPPRLGTPFNLDAINDMTKSLMGFELLGYINWLAGSDAQGILEMNSASAMSLMFANNSSQVWKEWFHPLCKMKEFVSQDKRVPLGPWYVPALQQEHLDAFHSQGGYTGVTRWYRMWRDNLFLADEKGFEDVKLTMPSLLVVPRDAEQQVDMLAAWTPHLDVVRFETGHWLHMERSAETNVAIDNFLQSLQ